MQLFTYLAQHPLIEKKQQHQHPVIISEEQHLNTIRAIVVKSENS